MRNEAIASAALLVLVSLGSSRAAALGGAPLTGASASPENIVTNGDFAAGLSRWSRAESVSWSPSGASTPGSAKINQADDARGSDALAQCFPVEAEALHDLAASVRLPVHDLGTGGVSVRVRWYATDACQGHALAGSTALDFSRVEPMSWQRKEARLVAAPWGARSAALVVVTRADAPDTYTIFVDDLSLTRSAGVATLTLPTAASVTGALGQRFQTDLFLRNPGHVERMVTLKLFPAGWTGGPVTPVVLRVGARETRAIPDFLRDVFGAHERAGAVELEYDPAGGPLQVTARAVTVHAASPGNGTSIPVSAGTGRASGEFFGFSWPDQRVNAGAFNASDGPVEVTFTLKDAAGGELATVSRTFAPYEWFQFNGLAGEAGIFAPPASIGFRSSSPVFPFAIAIDNRSGDATYLPVHD